MTDQPGLSSLPVAVIGAGPVGLAAAARLVERGLQPIVLEQGARVASAMLEWAHVRVFSPWEYNVDAAARTLLERRGIAVPRGQAIPTGGEIVRDYLEPLSTVPGIADGLRLGAKVTAISRLGLGLMSNEGRERAPFVVRYENGSDEHRVLARAVIDASGTWGRPNPLGTDGLPVQGESDAADLIAYGVPDVVGARREYYAGRRVLVVGGGHSAINSVLSLLEVQAIDPTTEIRWGLRRNSIEKLLGGGVNDQLPERGALGFAAKAAIDAGRVEVLAPFAVERIERRGHVLSITAIHEGRTVNLDVDRVIGATGFRPDRSFLGEIRVALDPAVEAPPALAPLIDPNFHSCGTVRPHGIEELRQPEPGFTIVGSKSYGRAPTFLMATGYEQVRSVVADIAGDHEAAREVRLVLPETGVCSAPVATGADACCGGPAPAGIDACCVLDAAAKESGKAGCGCGSASGTERRNPVSCAASA